MSNDEKGTKNLFNLIMLCPGCNAQKGSSRNNVLIPCGHLVCEDCVPQKYRPCPVCNTIIHENPQKLFV